MNIKLNPIQRTALTLLTFSLGAIIVNNFKTQILIHLVATLGFGLALFFIFRLISKQNKNIWNSIISCLILFLVLHYSSFSNAGIISFSAAIPALIATFVTIFFKFFLEYKGSPIMNPVILGLLSLILLSKIIPSLGTPFISWWGASYKYMIPGFDFQIPLTLIFIIIWMIFGLDKWRKFPIFFSYLISYALLFTIFYQAPEEVEKFHILKFIFTDSTIYFFTAIMLIEPRTSPSQKSQQIVYGMLAAIFSIIYKIFNISIFELLAIMLPNLYFFGTKFFKFKAKNVP